MKETYKKDLINKKKSSKSSSIYSITEKQDENNESASESNFRKQLITDNSNNNFIRNAIIDNSFQFKKYINKQKSSKSFSKAIENKDNNYMNISEANKNYFKDNDKKISRNVSLLSLHSGSEQNESNNTKNKLIHVNSSEHINQGNIDQKKMNLFQLFKKPSKIRKKSLNLSPKKTINKKFNKKLYISNSITSKIALRNNSFNYSYSISFIQNSINKKYYRKDTLFENRRKHVNDENNNTLSMNLVKKLKNSPLFEKSEKLLKKEKILYGVLSFFTLMSILFQTFDTFTYNKKSMKYLEENHKIEIYLQNEEFYYQLMEKRLISKEENCFRTFNLIFSLISVILVLSIYFTKKQFVRQSNKNNKNFINYYFGNKKNKNRNIKEDGHISILPDTDDVIPKKKLSKNELIITVLSCIINLIFYPPSLNKVFIKKNKQVINVYSLNSIILIFTFLKLINFYRVIVYLSPLNELVNKAICKENIVKMDFKFMLKYFLNRYPMIFIITSFILLCISYCILIFCIEYFSLDIVNGFWNKKGENNLRNLYNCIYLISFFITKNITGEIEPKSPLGIFIMFFVGAFGLFIFSYFLYYVSNLIQLTKREEKATLKLDKILNPLNKEHKSANLIKIVFLIKKMLKDYKNIEKDYKRIKKEKSFHETLRRNYDSNENIINNSFSSLIENSKYIEQNKFFNYLYNKFILKIKLKIECKNLQNQFLIARNYSHSFTVLLQTLGHKMDENLNQLNNKLQILIQKESKFSNYIRKQRITLGKIKRILNYHKVIIDYLINLNNTDNYEERLNNIKEMKKTGSFIGLYFNSHTKINKNKIKKHFNKLVYSADKKKNAIKKLKSVNFGIDQNIKLEEGIITKKTFEIDPKNYVENINKNHDRNLKSKSENPNFKNTNKLMRKSIAYNNFRTNNSKKNTNRKRKYSISNENDFISKEISGKI